MWTNFEGKLWTKFEGGKLWTTFERGKLWINVEGMRENGGDMVTKMGIYWVNIVNLL